MRRKLPVTVALLLTSFSIYLIFRILCYILVPFLDFVIFSYYLLRSLCSPSQTPVSVWSLCSFCLVSSHRLSIGYVSCFIVIACCLVFPYY